MNVKITELNDSYYVIVETKKGVRYSAIYSHIVTKEEVLEDFKENKSSFNIVK